MDKPNVGVTDEDFARVGKIVSIASGLEMQLMLLHAALTKCNPKISLITFYPISSAPTKISVLTSLAYNQLICIDSRTPEKDKTYADIEKLLARYRTFSEQRNKVVHGQWFSSEGSAKPKRMYIGPTFETLDYSTRYRHDSPKAQSAQDRNIFSADDMKRIIDDGAALQKDIEEFLQREASFIYSDKAATNTP